MPNKSFMVCIFCVVNLKHFLWKNSSYRINCFRGTRPNNCFMLPLLNCSLTVNFRFETTSRMLLKLFSTSCMRPFGFLYSWLFEVWYEFRNPMFLLLVHYYERVHLNITEILFRQISDTPLMETVASNLFVNIAF